MNVLFLYNIKYQIQSCFEYIVISIDLRKMKDCNNFSKIKSFALLSLLNSAYINNFRSFNMATPY